MNQCLYKEFLEPCAPFEIINGRLSCQRAVELSHKQGEHGKSSCKIIMYMELEESKKEPYKNVLQGSVGT